MAAPAAGKGAEGADAAEAPAGETAQGRDVPPLHREEGAAHSDTGLRASEHSEQAEAGVADETRGRRQEDSVPVQDDAQLPQDQTPQGFVRHADADAPGKDVGGEPRADD